MSEKLSPFLGSKYGWNFGESGWNTGMDQNILKFSFLFEGNVDGIVSSLPAPSNGSAYFLTTDNQFYFSINNTWYISPCPKNFIFKIKGTGDFYQFNGSQAIQINSPAQLDSRLDVVELVASSLGSAAFEDVAAFATTHDFDILEAQLSGQIESLASVTEDRLDSVGVYISDYGVTGDGSEEDAIRIDAAIDAAFNAGKTLYWGSGEILYSGGGKTRVSNYSGKSLKWVGDGVTIRCTKAPGIIWTFYTIDELLLEGVTLRGPGIVAPGATEADAGIRVYGCAKGKIERVDVQDFVGDGILLSSQYSASPSITDACRNITVTTSYFNNNGRGGLTIVGGDSIEVTGNTFDGDILPGAPAHFPGLHIEADTGPNRYGVDNIEIHGNTINHKLTIITAKQVPAVVSDPEAFVHVHHNKIVTPEEIAISGPGCGNVNIHDNQIGTTFSGVGSNSSGLIWLKGGNIFLRDNEYSVSTQVNLFNLTYWKNAGAAKEGNLIINGGKARLGVRRLLRAFGDSGVYSNAMWGRIHVCGISIENDAGARLFSLLPGSSPVKMVVENIYPSASLNTFLEFGANIPSGSQVLVKDTKAEATTAWIIPNDLAYAVMLDGSHVTGAYSAPTTTANTVVYLQASLSFVTDASGVPGAASTNEWPAAVTLTNRAVGKYDISGIVGDNITGQCAASAEIYTNSAELYRVMLSSDGRSGSLSPTLLVYGPTGALSNLPAYSRVSIRIRFPRSFVRI